jgi:hypothetical protein
MPAGEEICDGGCGKHRDVAKYEYKRLRRA